MKPRIYEILQIPVERAIFIATCYYLGLFTTYSKYVTLAKPPLLFDPLGLGKGSDDLAQLFPIRYRPLLKEVFCAEGETPWLGYSVRPQEWTSSGPDLMIFRWSGQFGVQRDLPDFHTLMETQGGPSKWKRLYPILQDWHQQRKLIKAGKK